MTTMQKKKSYAEIVDQYCLQQTWVDRWVEMKLVPLYALSEGFGTAEELRIKFVMRGLDFGFSLREIKFLMENLKRNLH